MASKPDKPITLVVRRGALRRFHKLQKETANLPVVVTWDRRQSDQPQPPPEEEPLEERRKRPSFTWELADFAVVPPSDATGEVEAKEEEPRKAKRSGRG